MPSKGYKQTAAHRRAIADARRGQHYTRTRIARWRPKTRAQHQQMRRMLAHLPWSLSPPLSPERATQCLRDLDHARTYMGKCKILRTYFEFPNAD